MIPAPLPTNEEKRLAALQRYAILDTLDEQSFDDLTFLASCILDKPIALISLIDKNRQWFKSKRGIIATETPRDISFCGHTILGTELLLVRDTLEDERFFDNPFVIGEPFIRFYAGMPVYSPDGYSLGTICVVDNKPSTITTQQYTALQALARQVGTLIEQKYILAELQEAVSTINLLNGIIPICTSCKNIRNDDQKWVRLETYIQSKSTAQFSHGICPDCIQAIYPELYEQLQKK